MHYPSRKHYLVGVGQLVLRIHQFNETQQLGAKGSKGQETMHFWKKFVDDFFHPMGAYRYIFVNSNNNETPTKKTFQLEIDSLPRLFNVIYSSGIKSVTYIMDNPREFSIFSTKTYLLLSEDTKVLYTYETVTVMLLGTLRVTFDIELKILVWEFEVKNYEVYYPKDIKVEDKNINDYGLHQNIMRYFEIVEGITYMKDLILFSKGRQLSPYESLKQYKIINMNRRENFYNNNIMNRNGKRPSRDDVNLENNEELRNSKRIRVEQNIY